IRAQVGELRLVGLPFGNDDVTHVATIEGLKTVKFVQTSAEPEAFAKLYEPISPKKKPTIEIVFFSEEKATTCKEFLLNQSIPITEKTKKTLQISQFNKETSY
ncbi:MAG: hypothetical protein KDK69_01995, partial [Chlamydiia bacterium]|nr:hypothetical protein [Chlamydiia bacterium]